MNNQNIKNNKTWKKGYIPYPFWFLWVEAGTMCRPKEDQGFFVLQSAPYSFSFSLLSILPLHETYNLRSRFLLDFSFKETKNIIYIYIYIKDKKKCNTSEMLFVYHKIMHNIFPRNVRSNFVYFRIHGNVFSCMQLIRECNNISRWWRGNVHIFGWYC
jgi:hypothetical protein